MAGMDRRTVPEWTLAESWWVSLMHRFGFSDNMDTFYALVHEYQGDHRHYHTLNHVRHCCAELEIYRYWACHPDDIELAIWFHDAIYEPLSRHNERRSADWAVKFLEANGAPAARVNRVRELIMATSHSIEPASPDAALLVDIDLSILAAPESTFNEFEEQVRREYAVVPGFLYRRKRIAILEGFLSRERIYRSLCIPAQQEAMAQANLSSGVSKLRSGGLAGFFKNMLN